MLTNERVQVEAAEEIERQRQEENLAQREFLMQRRGDSVNALVNSRYISLAVIAFVIGIVVENTVLIALSAFLFSSSIIAWFWSRNSLIGVDYQRRFHHTHVFPNETTSVELVVENRKWLPVVWLNIEDTWPYAFGPTDESTLAEIAGNQTDGIFVNAYSFRWYERVRRHYELRGRTRGIYEIGPVNLHAGDPFSWFERMVTIGRSRRDYLVVYPTLLPLQELGFPLHDPLGDKRVRRPLFEDASRVIGIRDYQPQDTFRDIHWKATARTGHLQSKVYEPTRGINVVLAVNVASFELYWRGVWPEMLEYTISMSASLAQWTAEEGYSFGLICNGAYARADQSIRVLPGRRPSQLKRVLEALAGVKFFVTKEFGRYVLDESPRLPVGAVIVMITPYISDMITTASLRLKAHGREVVWVVLGTKRPPEVPNIPLHHIPIPLDEPDWEAISGELTVTYGEAEADEIAQRLNARLRFLQQRAVTEGDIQAEGEES